MSAGFRSFSSFWWGPDGLGRPTKTYPSDILLQKVGIENSAPNDILIANKDIESGIVGDILLKKLNVYSELGFDILQKGLVESSLLEDILMSKTGSVENIMRVLVEKRNIESIVDDDIVVKKLDLISELDSDILHKRLGIETNSEADIFTLKTRAIGYGMIYHMKISDIEKSYYNSIGISKRAIKLKARKPPYERKIVESSVVSIGVRDIDDELEKQSREYPEDVEPEREKSKVSIEDYNDLL
jgi:hypothetical protein